jgi:hypothetical protein
MTNEQLSEYYGFKAYDHGFFEEWRNKCCEVMSKNIKANRADVYAKVYVELLNSKVELPQKLLAEV